MTKPDEEKDLASLIFTLVFMALVAIAAWRLIHHLPKLQPTFTPSVSADAPPSPQPSVQKTPQPKLKIRQDLLTQLLKAQSDQDQASLTNLLASLSNEAVRGMGNYRRVNYESWLLKARQSGLSVRAIEALADAQFISWFPSLKEKVINPRNLGQVWYAIARDQINQIRARSIQLPLSTEGKIANGKGTIYQLQLKQNQTINVKFSASEETLNLSILSQSDSRLNLLNKSTKDSWSGKTRQAGVYEVVITPSSLNSSTYDLEIK